MKPPISLPVLTMFAATNALGCYSTWDLSPDLAFNLDGFDGTPKTIKVVEKGKSEKVEVTSDTYLRFQMRDGNEDTAQFRSLRLEGGMLVGIERKTGDQLNVDLMRVK